MGVPRFNSHRRPESPRTATDPLPPAFGDADPDFGDGFPSGDGLPSQEIPPSPEAPDPWDNLPPEDGDGFPEPGSAPRRDGSLRDSLGMLFRAVRNRLKGGGAPQNAPSGEPGCDGGMTDEWENSGDEPVNGDFFGDSFDAFPPESAPPEPAWNGFPDEADDFSDVPADGAVYPDAEEWDMPAQSPAPAQPSFFRRLRTGAAAAWVKARLPGASSTDDPPQPFPPDGWEEDFPDASGFPPPDDFGAQGERYGTQDGYPPQDERYGTQDGYPPQDERYRAQDGYPAPAGRREGERLYAVEQLMEDDPGAEEPAPVQEIPLPRRRRSAPSQRTGALHSFLASAAFTWQRFRRRLPSFRPKEYTVRVPAYRPEQDGIHAPSLASDIEKIIIHQAELGETAQAYEDMRQYIRSVSTDTSQARRNIPPPANLGEVRQAEHELYDLIDRIGCRNEEQRRRIGLYEAAHEEDPYNYRGINSSRLMEAEAEADAFDMRAGLRFESERRVRSDRASAERSEYGAAFDFSGFGVQNAVFEPDRQPTAFTPPDFSRNPGNPGHSDAPGARRFRSRGNPAPSDGGTPSPAPDFSRNPGSPGYPDAPGGRRFRSRENSAQPDNSAAESTHRVRVRKRKA